MTRTRWRSLCEQNAVRTECERCDRQATIMAWANLVAMPIAAISYLMGWIG